MSRWPCTTMHLKDVNFLLNYIWISLRVLCWFLIYRYRQQSGYNTLVVCRYWFSDVVHLLSHELLIYAKSLAFMVGNTNIYGGVFYQMYLLPCINIPYFFKLGAMELWWCCILLLVHLKIFIRIWASMFLLSYWRFPWVIWLTSSFAIVFVSFSGTTCVWCPSGKISFQILHFRLQGHCWLYWVFPETRILVVPEKSR